MSNKLVSRLLSFTLSATVALTSGVPALAYDGGGGEDLLEVEDEEIQLLDEEEVGSDFAAEDSIVDEELVVEENEDEAEFESYADVKVQFTIGSDVTAYKMDGTDYTGTQITAGSANAVSVDSDNGFSFIVKPDTATGKKLQDVFVTAANTATYYKDYTKATYSGGWGGKDEKVAVSKVTSETEIGYMVSDFPTVKGSKVVTLTSALLKDVIAKNYDKNGNWAGDGATDTELDARPTLYIGLADAVTGSIVIGQPTAIGGKEGDNLIADTVISSKRTKSWAPLSSPYRADIDGITISPSKYNINDSKITLKFSKDGKPYTYGGQTEMIAKHVNGIVDVFDDIYTVTGGVVTANKTVQWDNNTGRLWIYQGLINDAYTNGWDIDIEIDVTSVKAVEHSVSIDVSGSGLIYKDGFIYAADGTTQLAKVEKASGKAFETTVKDGNTASILVTGLEDTLNNKRKVYSISHKVGTDAKVVDVAANPGSSEIVGSASVSNVKGDVTFYVELSETVTITQAATDDFDVLTESGAALTFNGSHKATYEAVSGKPFVFYIKTKTGMDQAVDNVSYKVGGKTVSSKLIGTNGKYTTDIITDALDITITPATLSGYVNAYAMKGVGNATVDNPAADDDNENFIAYVYYGDAAGFKAAYKELYGTDYASSPAITEGKVFAVVSVFDANNDGNPYEFVAINDNGYVAFTPESINDTPVAAISNGYIFSELTANGPVDRSVMPILVSTTNPAIANLGGKSYAISPAYKTTAESNSDTHLLGQYRTVTLLNTAANQIFTNINMQPAVKGEPYYFTVVPSDGAYITGVTYTIGESSTVYTAEHVRGDVYRTIAATGDIRITANELPESTIAVDADSAIEVTLADGTKVPTSPNTLSVETDKAIDIIVKPIKSEYKINEVTLEGTGIDPITYDNTPSELHYTITPGASPIVIEAKTTLAADPETYKVIFKNKNGSTEEDGKSATGMLRNTFNADGTIASQSLTLAVGETAILNDSTMHAVVKVGDNTYEVLPAEYKIGKTAAGQKIATFTIGSPSVTAEATKEGTDVITITHERTDGKYADNSIVYTGTLPLTVVSKFTDLYIDATSPSVVKGKTDNVLSIKGKNGRTGDGVAVTDSDVYDIVYEMVPDISKETVREFGFTSVSDPAAKVSTDTAVLVANTLQSGPITVKATIYKDSTTVLKELTKSFTVVPAETYFVQPTVTVAEGRSYYWEDLVDWSAEPIGYDTVNTSSTVANAIPLEKDGKHKTATIDVNVYKVTGTPAPTIADTDDLKEAIANGQVEKVDSSLVTFDSKIVFCAATTLAPDTARKTEYATLSGENGSYTVTSAKKTGAAGIEVVEITPYVYGIKQNVVKVGFSVTEKIADQNVHFVLEGRKFSADGSYEKKDGKSDADKANAAPVGNMLKDDYLAGYERSVEEDFVNKYTKGAYYTVESGSLITLPTENDFVAESRDKRAVLVGWYVNTLANVKDEFGKAPEGSYFEPGTKVLVNTGVTFTAIWAPRYRLIETGLTADTNDKIVADDAAFISNANVVSSIVDAEATLKALDADPFADPVMMDAYDGDLTSIAKDATIPVAVRAERIFGIEPNGDILWQPVYFTDGVTLAYAATATDAQKEAITVGTNTLTGKALAASEETGAIVATFNDAVEAGLTWRVTTTGLAVEAPTTYKVAFAKGSDTLNDAKTDLAAANKVTKITLEKSQVTAGDDVWPVAFISGTGTKLSGLSDGNVKYSIDNEGVVEFKYNEDSVYKLDLTPVGVGTATITATITDAAGNTATGTLPIEVVEDKVEIQFTNKAGEAVTSIEALGNNSNASGLAADADVGKVYAKAVLKSDSSTLTGSWNAKKKTNSFVIAADPTVSNATDGTGRRIITVDTTGMSVLGTEDVDVYFTYDGVKYGKKLSVTTYLSLILQGSTSYDSVDREDGGSDYLFVTIDGEKQLDADATEANKKDTPKTAVEVRIKADSETVTYDATKTSVLSAVLNVDLGKYAAVMEKDGAAVTSGEFKYWFLDDNGDANADSTDGNYSWDVGEERYIKNKFEKLPFATFTSGKYTLTPSMGPMSVTGVTATPSSISLINEDGKKFQNLSLVLSPKTATDDLIIYPEECEFFTWIQDDEYADTYDPAKMASWTDPTGTTIGAFVTQGVAATGLVLTPGTTGVNKGIATFGIGMVDGAAGKTELKVYSATNQSKLLATIPLRIDGLEIVVPDVEVYYIENGERVKNVTKKIGKYTYLFGEDGKQIVGDKIYDLNGKEILIRNGVVADAGIWTVGSDRYITSADGSILSGWQTYENKKYYADPANGNKLVDGFQTIGDKKYYFLSHALVTASESANEYELISGTTYYVNAAGEIAANGICKVEGKARLFRENATIVSHTDSDVVGGKITVGGIGYIISDDDTAEYDDIFYNAKVNWTKKFESKYTKGTGLPEVQYTITYTSKNTGKSVTTEVKNATVTCDGDYDEISTATELTFTATANLDGFWKDADAKEAATAAPLTETYKFKNGGLEGTTGQDIGGEMMVEGLEDEYFFTGSAIKPVITVTDGDMVLAQGVDYTVKYKNNTKISSKSGDEYTKTAEVTVTGKGNYAGQGQTLYFAIIDPKDEVKDDDADLTGASMKLPKETLIYTGEAVYPSAIELKLKGGSYVTYKHQGDGVYANDDSDIPAVVTFANNVNKGSATVMLTGKPNAKGATKTLKKNFTIKALEMNATDFTVSVAESAVWAVKGAQPEVTVAWNGSDLVLGQDFTVTYDKSNKKVGASKVTVKGKGNFTKKLEQSFTVAALPLAEEMVAAVSAFVGKKGAKVTLLDGAGNVIPTSLYTVSVFDGETDVTKAKLEADKDYTIKIAKKAGKTELGDDALEITAQAGINLSSVKINAKSVEKTFTGEAITLTDDDIAKITVTYKGTTLVYGTDYEITGYANNIKKGKMTVTIAGMGKYAGVKTFKVKIAPKPIAATN